MQVIEKKGVYRFQEFQLDPAMRILSFKGEMVSLRPKAFDLLLILIENRERVISKDELIEKLWEGQIIEENNLTVHISALRKALRHTKENPSIINHSGQGYQFVREVSIGSEDQTSPEGMAKDARIAAGNKYIWAFAIVLLFLMSYGVFSNLTRARKPVEPAASPKVNSIAVLPFQMLDEESEMGSLELGLTETLINRLSNLKSIAVKPIGAVRKYSGSNRNLESIGRELGVDSVLEGNIQKEGARIRLTMRLFKAESAETVWNEQIDENLEDIFAVQDRIAEKVAGSIRVALNDQEKSQIRAAITDNLDAYKKYLAARHHWNKRNPEGFNQSIKFYNQAIDIDPAFAYAYAGLADSYLLIGLYGVEPAQEAFPKARAAAGKALEITPDLAEAYISLAMVENLYQYDWQRAEAHFSRAVELNSNYATGHHWFGLFLAMQGKSEEAIFHLSRAKDIDPLSPSINTDLAFGYYLSNQFDKAIGQLEKTLKLDPDFANAHNHLGMNLLALKRFDEAIAAFEKAKALSGSEKGMIELIWANGFAGKPEKARELLAALPKGKKVSPFDMAVVYASLGERKKAFEYLNEAYEKRDPFIVPIKVYPPFESLRDDPVFKELLGKMNLN